MKQTITQVLKADDERRSDPTVAQNGTQFELLMR